MVTSAVDPSIKRLQKLMRHVEEVRTNCELIGTKLIETGELEIGRELIVSGMRHDASKFEALEWDHLWDKNDPLFFLAWEHHIHNNDHHPEFWGGIHEMSRRALGECVCDWAARSTEFGSALRPWIAEKATQRYHFQTTDRVYKDISEFLELLLEPTF